MGKTYQGRTVNHQQLIASAKAPVPEEETELFKTSAVTIATITRGGLQT